MSRWFQKKEEELPEKLRGKTEEELVKALDDAIAHKAALDTAVAEGTATKTELATAKTEIETIKAKMAELEQRQTPQRRESDQPAGPKSVFENEDEAFAQRTAPLNARVTMAGSLAARMTCKEAIENGNNSRVELRIWNKYANEVNTLMSKENPDRQIDPRAWFNAFIYVKGMHSAELLEAAAKKTDVFAEGGAQGGGEGLKDQNEKRDELSPAEIEIAKKFKMTPEKYLERKKAMKFSNVVGG